MVDLILDSVAFCTEVIYYADFGSGTGGIAVWLNL